MNELIMHVSKERIIPSDNILDLPSQFLEKQLYRMAYFLIQSIMNIIFSYNYPFYWDTEDEKVKNSLRVIFPVEWLEYATQYYENFTPRLNMKKLMNKYPSLTDDNVNLIYLVVEFFCFEVIETSILLVQQTKKIEFSYRISYLHPYDILQGIYYDDTLEKIIREQKIYIVDTITIKSKDVKCNLNISKKGLQLIRIYIEILINELI